METTFYPSGVCSRQYDIDIEDGIIKDIRILGGCNGNLQGISALIKGKKAEEVIPLIRGINCGGRGTSCPDQISYALEEALNRSQKTYSSGSEFDMDKEYMFATYKYLRRENNPEFGADSANDIVIRMINFDTLCYMFHSHGAHMVLFGGPWSEMTCSIIDQVNYYARKYNIDEVFFYDFSADGQKRSTIKQDITAQPSYQGPGKKPENEFAVFNYLYGEIVSHFLTNLNDWVADKIGTDNDITYLNVYQDPVTVPNIREPFLFIYNRDNTIDHSNVQRDPDHLNESGTYPVVYAMELNAYRDDNDMKFYKDRDLHNTGTYIDSYSQTIESRIFSHVGEEGCEIVPYTNAQYVIESFAKNGRGHSYKTQDAFAKDEQINIHTITLQQFRWMAAQKGNFMFYMAGPWCAFSQGGIATVNDYAVANDVQVYMLDSRLDSKHAIDFWKYPRVDDARLTHPALRKYYIEIWEQTFPCVQVLTNIDPARYWSKPTLEYTDDEGSTHTVLLAGIPFLLAYNKDHANWKGQRRPVLASKHDAGELIDCSEVFVYYAPFYHRYRAAIYYVFYEYMKAENREFHDITIDRTQDVAEGTPEKHPETIAYHKEHDWFKELAPFGNKFAQYSKAVALKNKAQKDKPQLETGFEESCSIADHQPAYEPKVTITTESNDCC